LLVSVLLTISNSSYARATTPFPGTASKSPYVGQSTKEPPKDSSSQDLGVVEVGYVTERQLKGGESHSFHIQLAAGQFLHAVVDQRGIDVVVTLVGPAGKPLLKVDNPNSNHGPEPLVVIAETSGDFRIDVSAPNQNARPGNYGIKIVVVRAATKRDMEYIAADRAFAQGSSLRVQRTAASGWGAIEAYKQALPFFQSAGDPYWQALTLRMVAVVYGRLGEFPKAVEYYQQALPLFRVAGDKYQESSALIGIGGAHEVLGNTPKALAFYRQALLVTPKGEEPALEGAILSNIGKIYYDLSDWQMALEYYHQALSRFRAIGEKRGAAITLSNIGVAYSSLGEREKSLDYYREALSLQHGIGDKAKEAETLTNMGFTYAGLGQVPQALEAYAQALPLRKAAGDRLGEATTLDYMGMAYSSLGEQDKALNYHQQALELGRAVGDQRGEARTLSNLGYLYAASGQWEKSAEYYNQALAGFRRVGDRQSEASALYGLARTERNNGNLAGSREHLEAALSLFEDVRVNAGAGQLRASYLASKQDAYQFYIGLLMELHRRDPTKGHDAIALQTSERARARSLLDMLGEAHVDIRQGVDAELLERERNLKQQLSAQAQRQIRLLGQKTSQDQLVQLNKDLGALEDEYQQVQAQLRKKSPGYASLTQPRPLDLKEIQNQLEPGTLLLEYSLGEDRSYVWAITQTSLKTFELPKREQIEKAARQVYGLLTARSQFKGGESPQVKEQRIAQTDSQLPNAIEELSKLVLGPIGSELGSARLVIVPDGALQYVPFSVLSVVSDQRSVSPSASASDHQPLIQEHEIVSLPSASALAIQRQGLLNRKPAPNNVAVIADPVFSADDERVGARARVTGASASPGDGSTTTRIIEHLANDSGLVIRRLKFTRQEADRILAEAPRSKNLRSIDFKASRGTATGGELSKYRYVHFATHGYIDSERSNLSAIVLSLVDAQGQPQDGFLRVMDIYNLNLPAELVVLSACETGLGKEVKGEGLVGLTQGFMYAGARRVVVSLWNVNDKATADLMARFYRGMLRENKTPAAALRAAQMEMSQQKQWQSPYYWAAFTLQGEWR
jgi:CHAT domain-containing protein/tetratricopeptide (TPR) repeat protein